MLFHAKDVQRFEIFVIISFSNTCEVPYMCPIDSIYCICMSSGDEMLRPLYVSSSSMIILCNVTSYWTTIKIWILLSAFFYWMVQYFNLNCP